MSTNTALDQIKARVEGHTEGPWETLSGEWGTTNKRLRMLWAGQRDDSGYIVATAFAEQKADAELIAAAPKLLAALEAVQALHVPEAAGAVGAPEQLECSHCIDPHDSAWRVAWPCPTIKAIEEALR